MVELEDGSRCTVLSGDVSVRGICGYLSDSSLTIGAKLRNTDLFAKYRAELPHNGKDWLMKDFIPKAALL